MWATPRGLVSTTRLFRFSPLGSSLPSAPAPRGLACPISTCHSLPSPSTPCSHSWALPTTHPLQEGLQKPPAQPTCLLWALLRPGATLNMTMASPCFKPPGDPFSRALHGGQGTGARRRAGQEVQEPGGYRTRPRAGALSSLALAPADPGCPSPCQHLLAEAGLRAQRCPESLGVAV